MSRFRNTMTGVVVTVDDSKDDRFANLEWEADEQPTPKKAASKAADSK